MKIAAILLSRQALRPCRHTSWVRQTLNAIKWVKQNHLCLCTSLGIQTWEFLIYLAQSREIMQRVLIPAKNDQEFDQIKNSVTNQFGLDPSLVRFRSITPTDSQIGREALMSKRDRVAVFESDILIPVSIRAKGHMEKLILEKSSKKEGVVNWEFQIKYHKREHPLAYHINTRDLPHETVTAGNRYIVHWTRTPNGPWPYEKKYHYFSSIESSESYPRHAFLTLQHIIETGKIFASSNHMPKGVSVVSFSGLTPEKILPLMKWRSRYRRMSFEPYGIGIEKATAWENGIVPVHYYHRGKCPKNLPLWQLQSRGTITDWAQEAEYRYPGNLDLSGISREKVACFCHTREEAHFIERSFAIKTYSFIS